MSFDGFLDAILESGFFTFSIFILLLVLSVATWGIIITKYIQLKKEDRLDQDFVRQFNKADDLLDFFHAQQGRSLVVNDLGIVFMESLRIVEQFKLLFPGMNFIDPDMKPMKENFEELVERTIHRIALQTAERRETAIGVLATTSNIAPFLGLLGTVIGIINAFTAIGASGSADLSTVAPAISEALVATALGLFVAIPASAAFNMFQFWTQNLAQKFDRYSVILQNRIQQQFLQRRET